MSARSVARKLFPAAVLMTAILLAAAFLWLTGGSIRVRAFRLASGAMSGTLLPGDLVFVDLTTRPPHRGRVSVITCGRGEGWCLYRVIGLAGDTVAVQEHRAYVNGTLLDEPYARIPPRTDTDSVANRAPVVVPPGHVWVLGDNRAESYDSRFWGFVPLAHVHGRPVSIYWSWDADSGRVRWSRIGKRIP